MCTKERVSVARGDVIWLCWSASVLWPFPDSHPHTHTLLHTPRLQGLRHKPLSPEESTLLGRAKGKFGIKIPKSGMKKFKS